MKFKLKSGKVKDTEEMTEKEIEEVDKEFVKGLITFGATYAGLKLLDKL